MDILRFCIKGIEENELVDIKHGSVFMRYVPRALRPEGVLVLGWD